MWLPLLDRLDNRFDRIAIYGCDYISLFTSYHTVYCTPTDTSPSFPARHSLPSSEGRLGRSLIWSERATIIADGCGVGEFLRNAAPEDKEAERNALRAVLMSKMPDSIFLTVKSLKEPHQLMDALKARFGVSTAITQANSLERLYTLKCADGKKIQAHLDDLIQIKDALAEAGVTITDRDFLSAIISSIPQSYIRQFHPRS